MYRFCILFVPDFPFARIGLRGVLFGLLLLLG
jgi:hypothetical protein